MFGISRWVIPVEYRYWQSDLEGWGYGYVLGRTWNYPSFQLIPHQPHQLNRVQSEIFFAGFNWTLPEKPNLKPDLKPLMTNLLLSQISICPYNLSKCTGAWRSYVALPKLLGMLLIVSVRIWMLSLLDVHFACDLFLALQREVGS